MTPVETVERQLEAFNSRDLAAFLATFAEDICVFDMSYAKPPLIGKAAFSGHDSCIIPIKEEHIDAWLNPDRRDLAAQYAMLDDRERPFYEHQLAA